MKIAGIDYGSKMAGTTVMAIGHPQEEPFLIQSAKKQDADQLILQTLVQEQVEMVFLDAPLSLPGVYRGLPGCTDYFYRAGDRQVNAMSPMFLGGLTARAMQLTQKLKEKGIQTWEVYPGYLAQQLGFKELGYKKGKDLSPLLEELQQAAPFVFSKANISNWHAFDALLAYLSGHRYLAGEAELFGDSTEGLIVV
jgi:predicted nuclease with RNAse H fold